MRLKYNFLIILWFGIFILGCQKQYAYRSKVKVNKQEIVKAKPEPKDKEGEREGEERVEMGEITAGEGVQNILPFLPIIKLEFGKKENKRDSVVTAFRKEYKSLKQKFPENESSVKYSNLTLFAGIALLVLSFFIGLEVGFLLALLMGLFGIFLIIFNLVKRHRIENKELIERKKAFRNSADGREILGLKYRRNLSLVLMFLTLTSLLIFINSSPIFLFMLFAGPALLGAGIVSFKLDIDHQDEEVQIIAIILGAAATILLIFLLFVLAISTVSIFFPLLLLALALLLFFIGRELAKIYSPKRY